MKKLLAAILCIAMLFSFAACGGTTTGNKETEDLGDNPIIVGSYMPLTGNNAGSGLVETQGMQIAFDAFNAAGGLNGRKIKFIQYDSTGTSEGATKAVTRLIEEDSAKIIAGSFLSASVLAASALTEKAKVLHVGTGTGATWTNIGLNYTYRATANGSLPVATMVDEIIDLEKKSIALISAATEYGQSGHDSIIAECAAENIEVKIDLTYQSADTDFSGIISRLLKAEADTIVLYGNGNELAVIIKQLRQNGYEDLIFTIEGGANSEMFTVARDASNGLSFAATYVVPATPEEAATPLMKQLLTDYYATYKEMPYSDCFYRGYDQGMLIVEAIKNAENPDDGESLMKAFRNIKGMELLGGTFDYTDGTGDGLTQVNKWMILDGKIQVYDKAALQAFENK